MLLFNMNSWIISIACLALLTSILSFLIPKGRLDSSIKFIFSLVMTFVILQPLIGLKDFDNFNNFLNGYGEITLQEDYLNFINESKITNLEKNCINILEKEGIKNGNINIEYSVAANGQVIIDKVIINLANSVFIEENNHKYVIDKSIKSICDYLDVKIESVNILYE